VALYDLPDEPRPGLLKRAVVDPMWPLIAFMVAGPWLSWPWFVVNAHAVGSRTKWRETFLMAGGFVVSAVLLLTLIAVFDMPRFANNTTALRLSALGVLVWKLGVTYWLFVLQAPSVSLFRYYRGATWTQAPVVLVGGFLVTQYLLDRVPVLLRVIIR
jgi:hypothetical protein